MLALLVGVATIVTWSAIWGLPLPRSSRLATAHPAPLVAGPPAQEPSPSAPTGPLPVIPVGRSTVHVPILEYHYIRVNPNPKDALGFNLSVTSTSFKAQMDWLATHGYHPIEISDLRAYFQGEEDLPAKPVVLTFDDGYQDFYTAAWPILRALGFTAVTYIVPGFLGRSNYMTADELVHLDGAGIEIGSHTVHHVNLTRASPANLQIELTASKGYLEQLLGHPVLDFCYPSGRFNATVEAAVAAAGYQSATTEQPGTAHSLANRWAWTRVRVAGGERLSAFVASLGPSDPTRAVASPLLPTPLS